jgi:hypothetical protein
VIWQLEIWHVPLLQVEPARHCVVFVHLPPFCTTAPHLPFGKQTSVIVQHSEFDAHFPLVAVTHAAHTWLLQIAVPQQSVP